MDIEFATNMELIEELHRRATFAGVIVFSAEEHKTSDQHHSLGIMTTGDKESTINMLEIATETMINFQE